MDIRVGDKLNDMVVIGETYVTSNYRARQFKSRRIVCECCVCGRHKIFQPSTFSRGVWTYHRMCNHDFTEKIAKEYPEFYRWWSHIKARINNPNIEHYDRYGGRGLKNDYEYFVDFCDDMLESYLDHIKKFGKDNTTIERKDNDLGYVKGNLVWATWKEQAVNRCTTVEWVIYDRETGIRYSTNNLKDFCDKHSLNHKVLHMAISRGQEACKGRWEVVRVVE